MNCQKVDNLLSAFIDREVSPEESREIRLHVEECDLCRQTYLELSQVKDALASLGEIELPPGFHSHLLDQLKQAEEPWIMRWLQQFKPLVFAGALGVLFATIGLPLAQGAKVVQPDPLSDLRFLISEHQRFQQSEPFSNSLPPTVTNLLPEVRYRPVHVDDFFIRTVSTEHNYAQEVVLSHHLRY
ncbi:MAG: zf-HC2 domain-containing protein [Firmicutes bacterium]|nr:zf-HC2 domain-containing protein [Bacillota bacterium]